MDKEERDRSRERERSRRDRSSRFSDTSRDRSVDRGKERGGMKSSNCRVFVSNIPYECRWQDLKDLFRSQVGEVSFVELFVDENDKPRGCGIVEFAESSSVKKCLECMHRFELKNRKIVIKEDLGNSRDKYGNLIGAKRRENRDDNRDRRDDRRGGGGGGGGGMGNFDMTPWSMMGDNKWGNTYGLSPAFLEELGINGPLNTRVFVANLEYKVDKKKLKEVFRMAGKVQFIDMPMNRDGQSRGFAVIEYDHPVESVQAISMFHNQPLFDRMMTVRMDRGGERDKIPEGLKSIGPGLGTNGEPLRDVARNLPSLSNQGNANNGAGILGAVPNLQLGVNAVNAANALSNLNVGGLGNLTSTSAVLQAANLAGVGGLSNNLLSGGLGNTELNLAANLVQNTPLAALAASQSNLNNVQNNLNNFNRSDNQQNFISNQNTGYNSGGNNSNMGRNYSSFDSKQQGGFNFGGSDRDSRPGTNSNIFNNMNNGGQQMMRGSSGNMKSNYSKKILISNLPPTASYKMLNDKCQEFGTVEHVEEHASGGIVVSFQSDWEAERAIKNMDRARIDGRTIDVHFI